MRFSALQKALVASALSLAQLCALAAVLDPPLPTVVSQVQPQLHRIGQDKLTFLFWKIYDIALYTSGSVWKPDEPYALAVIYNRHFTGPEIADEGVKQMQHLGYQDKDELSRWRSDMLKGFPSVVPGDRVAAVFIPPDEVRFYINDNMTADIKDSGFATAFFGIWLDPKTSEPKLRRTLLNEGQ